MKKTQLLRFPTATPHDPGIEFWMTRQKAELVPIARKWFEVMRMCGDDVRELLHDGHPTACVGNAGFGYVNAFTEHVNVGFFRGADLDDPDEILEGTGKFMRHVKLRPAAKTNEDALLRLIQAAYEDMRRRVRTEEAT